MDTKGNERADELAKIAAQKADANYDYEKIPLSGPQHKNPKRISKTAATLRTTTTERILDCAETVGKPGIQTRGVALFMDRNTERPGIGFGSPWGKSSVSLSPGLANLINSNTSRTSLKRKTFDSLEQLVIEGESCRMVRTRNKIVLLYTVYPGK
ncbi:hypothetical protein EVAR_92170_1 [Eumeta japonica]|uniref:RNase H type-1 domain-containing protein n=1 Tax=Eumeta variegata TaxID=151549 RepID=A0A4C1SYN4_EUMVA|nr:hypothetical protein EVAR_92170_1 [Eumeta japonica]